MLVPEPPFRVLYVCTGNICRSPVAERLLRRDLGRQRGLSTLIDVRSAGVHGYVGHPMDAKSAAALVDLGGDPRGFVARRLDPELVRSSDLVLTANRRHRAAVTQLVPSAGRRSFTMREFAQLIEMARPGASAGETPRGRLAALVEHVSAVRDLIPDEDSSELDVEDPYQGPASLHHQVGAVIAKATMTTSQALVAAARDAPVQGDDGSSRHHPGAKRRAKHAKPRRRSHLPALWACLALLALCGAAVLLSSTLR